MLDLALADQVLHRTGHLLDRHHRINAVLVEKVDAVRLQPLERSLDDVADVLRPAVHALVPGRAGDVDAEFGGDHHLITDRLQCLADDLLILERPIDLRGVEESDAALECRADQADGIRRRHRLPIGLADPHAAEPDGRDLEATLSKCAFLHCHCPFFSTPACSKTLRATPIAVLAAGHPA